MWLVRYMRGHDTSPTAPRWAWLTLLVVGLVGMVLMQFAFHRWQDEVRDLMGVAHLRWYNYPQAAVIAIVVLFLFVEIGQWFRQLVLFWSASSNTLRRPGVVAVGLVLALSIALLNGVVLKGRDGLVEPDVRGGQRRGFTKQRPRPHRCGPAVPNPLVSWARWGTRAASSSRAGPPSSS